MSDTTLSGSQGNDKQEVVGNRWLPMLKSRWFTAFLAIALLISLLANWGMYVGYQEYFSDVVPPIERMHSGEADADEKIALIQISGAIMPPFTERTLKAIERAHEDESVRGVILVVDSPGGLVADSHQIYHRLVQLREEKPVWVSMKRIAASGGLYVAMGAGNNGKVYAEPTTWTGSIGVIIPRFDLSEMAKKVGLATDSIKTGEFKDSLNSFRPMSENDIALWDEIIEDSFSRFINVIADNRRNLSREKVRNELATGQIFTATQAQENGLVDKIAFEDEVIDDFKEHLKLDECRVVRYSTALSLSEVLLNGAQAKPVENPLARMLEPTVPRAMYFCAGSSGIPRLPKNRALAN